MAKRRYWLFKTEPDAYSIADLQAAPRQTGTWDGVRNYQARNLLRDQVQLGDGVLIYHSRIKELGIVGTARVVRAGFPDPTQFDPSAKYFDARSDPAGPRWVAVEIQLAEIFPRTVTLAAMRDEPALATMRLLERGQRLSIQPVTPQEWKRVLALARRKTH